MYGPQVINSHTKERLVASSFLAVATRLLKQVLTCNGFLCGHTSNQVGNRKTHGDEEDFQPSRYLSNKTNKKLGSPTQLLTNGCFPGTLNQLQSVL